MESCWRCGADLTPADPMCPVCGEDVPAWHGGDDGDWDGDGADPGDGVLPAHEPTVQGFDGRPSHSFRAASFGRRLAALAGDLAVLGMLVGMAVFVCTFTGIGFGASVVAGLPVPAALKGVLLAGFWWAVGVLLWAGYGAMTEGARQQATPAKRFFGVLVTDAQGRPPGTGRALHRNALKAVLLPIALVWRPGPAGAGTPWDVLAGTRVWEAEF